MHACMYVFMYVYMYVLHTGNTWIFYSSHRMLEYILAEMLNETKFSIKYTLKEINETLRYSPLQANSQSCSVKKLFSFAKQPPYLNSSHVLVSEL